MLKLSPRNLDQRGKQDVIIDYLGNRITTLQIKHLGYGQSYILRREFVFLNYFIIK